MLLAIRPKIDGLLQRLCLQGSYGGVLGALNAIVVRIPPTRFGEAGLYLVRAEPVSHVTGLLELVVHQSINGKSSEVGWITEYVRFLPREMRAVA